MASCLDCLHWKPCFGGKEWDARIEKPCEYFKTTKDKDTSSVVRCYECKHYTKSMMLCNLEDGLGTPDKLDYCSYGERWEEE